MVTFTEADFTGFTRRLTDADIEALGQAEVELEKRGFDIQSKKNALTLLRSFDQAKHIPITAANLIKTVETFKDSFDWLSSVEIEYQKNVDRLGPDATATIEGFIDKRRFVRDGEEHLETFNCLANYMLATGRQVTIANLDNAIGNILNSPQGKYGYLRFDSKSRPTVESERIRLEMEAKAKANTPIRKVTQEERDRAVSHIGSNDANDPRSSVRKIDPDSPLGRHQAGIHAAIKATERQVAQEQDPTEAYFGQRVADFINWVPSTNDKTLVQERAQELRAQGMSWSRVLVNVENFYNRLTADRWQSQQRG